MKKVYPRPKDRPRRASWIGLMVAIAVSLAVVLRVLLPFVAVVLLALVAAGMIAPAYRRLVRLVGGHRHTAGAIVCGLLLVTVLVPVSIIATDASREAFGFYVMSTTEISERGVLQKLKERQEGIEQINRFLEPINIVLTAEDLSDWVASTGVRVGAFFYKQGMSIAKGLVRFVFGFIFWVVVLFYLLVDGEHARAWFRDTIPIPAEEQQQLSERFMEMASSLVVGNGVAGIIQGVAGGLVFAAVGLPGPVLWGAVMGILAFIPVIGISLVFVPTSVALLIAGEPNDAFAVFIPLAIISTVVEYWLKPMLVGRRGQMHTLLVFLSLIGGLEAFGALGILIGPLMMTAFLTLVSIYREHYLPWLTVACPAPEAAPLIAKDEGGAESSA